MIGARIAAYGKADTSRDPADYSTSPRGRATEPRGAPGHYGRVLRGFRALSRGTNEVDAQQYSCDTFGRAIILLDSSRPEDAVAPRRYRQRARATTQDATRDHIIAAATRLHAERGVSGTSWDDLAAAAGVSRATVYRHFRNLAELIPACSRDAFEAIDLPALAEFEAGLADLHEPAARLARVIQESCACYERGAGWLRAARREADFIPELANVCRRIRDGAELLVEAALAGMQVDGATRTALSVLVDYPFWEQLIDAGVAPSDAPQVIARLMTPLLTSEGGSHARTRRR